MSQENISLELISRKLDQLLEESRQSKVWQSATNDKLSAVEHHILAIARTSSAYADIQMLIEERVTKLEEKIGIRETTQ